MCRIILTGNNNMRKLAIVFKRKWNRFSHYLKNILQNDIASLCITPPLCRRLIYNVLGHNVKGEVFPRCFLGVARGKLTLGRNSFINYSCFLDLSNDIIIGDGVSVAFKTIFINASHEIGPIEHRAGKGINAPIRIEDGCWIGANVTIMSGVTIAKGCIIGAGALVVEDTEENGIYVGRPARLIKKL